MTDRAARSGDIIVLKRADGRYNVLRINDKNEREGLRAGVTDLHGAYTLARSELVSGGKVWVAAESAPDSLESYR